LWNYIRGYVIILVEGYFLEKFMNICTHRQILLWDIKVQKDCAIVLKVSIKGFKLLRPVARKTKSRVRIIRKKGLPFLFNKYRRRKTFFAGAFLFVLLLYIMTSFIWSIEISGNKDLETSYIVNVLSSYGIKPGALKYSIDTKKAVTEMMLGVEKLSWISIDVKGTKVRVELRERVQKPDMVPKDKPCNIIATKDGFIKQILVTDGIEAVHTGDTVQKGQVLIAGNIPIKNEKDKFRQVHAMGVVKARTWYEEEVPVEQQVSEKVKTGREFINYSLVLFTKKIDLFHKNNPYENFDVEDIDKKLSVGNDLVFPFELILNKYSENKIVTTEISETEARKTAEEKAINNIMERKPENAEIVKNDVKYIDDEVEGLTVKVTMECIEEIGTTEEIGGN
jgi:sporulation protein YqfD